MQKTICKNCGDTITKGIHHIPDNRFENGVLLEECIVKGLFTRYKKLMQE